jgi:hypothetical protein
MGNTEMKTLNLGNNEQVSRGIASNGDGTFTAMTFTKSKDFKTLAGAVKWMDKNSNGWSK